MPQMAPLMWMNLFFSFSLIMMIVMTKISFSHTPSLNLNSKMFMNAQSIKLNWNW